MNYEAIHRIYRMAGKEVQDVRPGSLLTDLSEAEAADLLKIGAIKRIEERVAAVAAAEQKPEPVIDAAPEKKGKAPRKGKAAEPEAPAAEAETPVADEEDFG